MPRMVVSIQISTALKTSTPRMRRCLPTEIDRSLTVMSVPCPNRQGPVNSGDAHNGGVEDQGCSTFQVRHAWLSMRAVVADALLAHDLSVAQFASLLILADSPGR